MWPQRWRTISATVQRPWQPKRHHYMITMMTKMMMSTDSNGGDSSCRKRLTPLRPNQREFWTNRDVWRRAGRNTLRCLIGCSVGDLTMMFYLQSHYPELSTALTMGISMVAGISTSICLETSVLRIKEGFQWMPALRTAMNMSFMSMLAMELAENAVSLSITGGAVDVYSMWFWLSLAPSLLAGYVTPLPYNYYQLQRYGRACH